MAPDKSCAEQDIGNEVSRFCGVKTTVPHYRQCALVAKPKMKRARLQITGTDKGFTTRMWSAIEFVYIGR